MDGYPARRMDGSRYGGEGRVIPQGYTLAPDLLSKSCVRYSAGEPSSLDEEIASGEEHRPRNDKTLLNTRLAEDFSRP